MTTIQLAGALLLQLCAFWQEAQQVGTLPRVIDEASGVAFSRQYAGRMYHVNDSGDSGRFFVTDTSGKELQRVRVRNFAPVDVEDLRVGPCATGRSCIFIADIGDNERRRSSIEVVIVEEVAVFGESVVPWKRIRLKYPNGPHNAESMMVHPNGTIFFLTKNSGTGIDQLFKLTKDQWERGGDAIRMLSAAGSVDLGKVFPQVPGLSPAATSMDISEDGRRALILTYLGAAEFSFDPTTTQMLTRPQRIPLKILQQQEAIAYIPGKYAFAYTTERSIFSAAIMNMSCRPDR